VPRSICRTAIILVLEVLRSKSITVVGPSGVRLGIDKGVVAKGYQPDMFVLPADRANTSLPLALDPAHQSANRKLRGITVGSGTTVPGLMVCTQVQSGSDVLSGDGFAFGFGFGGGGRLGGGFGGGRGGGFRRFLLLDKPTLQALST